MYSYSGFTSELNNMLNGFAYSIATQRRFLVVDTLWNYGSFENYFDTYRSGLSPYSTSDVSCSRHTEDFVQMAINKSDIDVNVPFYALHIRRGDKLMTESPRNLSIDDYIKGIDHLQK
ncbi:unnamed protein product [Adineta steineri]|uniref:Uncharacterized protein n=1 Tax=Adineta steineri TaxID=433720 RepID=A0A819R6J6_9BILA|nr:unnamed protein product [Adineta steineri]